MVLVFDLDDTLYNERNYVLSGFRAVSGYLGSVYSVPEDEAFQLMALKLELGRGRIFDDTLEHFGLCTRKRVLNCISVYRGHAPDIRLDRDADACLERFSEHPLYIVTDGNKYVQNNKLVALGLFDRVRSCYITHRYGVKNSKPSSYCFFRICEREGVPPTEVVYVADNPNKDFVGIKPHGFRTVRLMQGHYRDLELPAEYEADHRLTGLSGLDLDFLDKVFRRDTTR